MLFGLTVDIAQNNPPELIINLVERSTNYLKLDCFGRENCRTDLRCMQKTTSKSAFSTRANQIRFIGREKNRFLRPNLRKNALSVEEAPFLPYYVKKQVIFQ